jgi:hypothetical protein
MFNRPNQDNNEYSQPSEIQVKKLNEDSGTIKVSSQVKSKPSSTSNTIQMEGGGQSGTVATVFESSLASNNPYKNGHSFRAIRKYDMVNEPRDSRDMKDDITVHGGVYKQRVPNSQNIELDR